MFPTVQPGTAMTVKETRAGEACVIIITGPFLLSIKCIMVNFLKWKNKFSTPPCARDK
jgi:hypothetical protein